MNEVLIKEVIKYKINTFSSIVNHLPPKVSREINDLSRIILDAVNEGIQEMKDQTQNASKSDNKLDNITIE